MLEILKTFSAIHRGDLEERIARLPPGVHRSWAEKIVPDGEPINGKILRGAGWAYEDFLGQWFSREEFASLLEAIGDENFHILALSQRDDRARGQIVVAPGAIPVLEAWKATRPGRTAPDQADSRQIT